MKKILIIFLLAICFESNAKFIQTIELRYQTTQGWSKYYTVDATFMTGFELNRATNTYDYNSYLTYCIVWWGSGQCSLIALDYVTCGYEASPTCLSYYYGLNGKDQDNTKWDLCLTYTCY
jgi:hypothetical protein